MASGLTSANARKAAEASVRNQEVARRILLMPSVPKRWWEVAQARLDYPGFSMRQLAEKLGMPSGTMHYLLHEMREHVKAADGG